MKVCFQITVLCVLLATTCGCASKGKQCHRFLIPVNFSGGGSALVLADQEGFHLKARDARDRVALDVTSVIVDCLWSRSTDTSFVFMRDKQTFEPASPEVVIEGEVLSIAQMPDKTMCAVAAGGLYYFSFDKPNDVRVATDFEKCEQCFLIARRGNTPLLIRSSKEVQELGSRVVTQRSLGTGQDIRWQPNQWQLLMTDGQRVDFGVRYENVPVDTAYQKPSETFFRFNQHRERIEGVYPVCRTFCLDDE